MKRQVSNTTHGLKFAIEKNDFERLKSSSGKKRNDFVDHTEKNLAQMLPLAVKLLRLAEESCATMHLGMLRSHRG